MTIDEAIKELRDLHEETVAQIYNERENAIKLGIEALKLVQRQRPYLFNLGEIPLPGETKD